MDAILEINNLCKNYGRIKALRNLSLKIQAGSVFGLLGPNGSGKTTTLGIILDVVQQTSGEFYWFGKVPSSAARKKIGALLEGPAFYPYLSAVDNLRIAAQIKESPYSKIDEVLKIVNLTDRKDDKFENYSLGMKQRLAIASALLSDPSVLVLDEPTNGLDPQGIADVREIILKIASEGKTIILASHLLDEVQKVCSHFAILNHGQTIFSGSVGETLSGEEAVELASPNNDLLLQAVGKFQYVADCKVENGKLFVHLSDGKTAYDLNSFLVSHGTVVSHLVTKTQNLEEQFLRILSQTS